MIRWLAMSIVTLAGVAVASDSASPTPTTQPSIAAAGGQVPDFAKERLQIERQLRDIERQFHEMDLQLGRLRPLPEFHFDVQAAPYDIKPYGRPFRFNGLTVYVEPIAEFAAGPTTPTKNGYEKSGKDDVFRADAISVLRPIDARNAEASRRNGK
jgi:hypothetical protein